MLGTKSIVACMSAGALLAACSPQHNGADDQHAKDVAAITAIEREMAAAQKVDGVVRTWADDMVWYEIGPVEIHGGKAATALITKQFEPLGQLRTEILRLKVNASGNIGYAYSTQRFVSDLKAGGSPLTFVFRETDIFEKRQGSWKLVHQHISVPADLGAGKAIVSPKDTLDYPLSVRPQS